MSTIQQLVDGARNGGLEDADKVHWLDGDLLQYAQDCFSDLKNMRPDLFVGNWTFDPYTLTLGSPFPLESAYVGKCQQYIIARANLADSEFVTSGRAALAQQIFAQGML